MTELQERIKQLKNVVAEIEDEQQTEWERLVLDLLSSMYSKDARLRVFVGACMDLFSLAVCTEKEDKLLVLMAFVYKEMSETKEETEDEA